MNMSLSELKAKLKERLREIGLMTDAEREQAAIPYRSKKYQRGTVLSEKRDNLLRLLYAAVEEALPDSLTQGGVIYHEESKNLPQQEDPLS